MSDNSMNTAGTVSHAEVQAFLDEVLALDLPKKYSDWYQVDVSAVLGDCVMRDVRLPVGGKCVERCLAKRINLLACEGLGYFLRVQADRSCAEFRPR